MVKTTVYLNEADAKALRSISKRQSKPQAQLIREAIHDFTAAEPPPLPAGMGQFDSGTTDTTARRKEILATAARSGRWRS